LGELSQLDTPPKLYASANEAYMERRRRPFKILRPLTIIWRPNLRRCVLYLVLSGVLSWVSFTTGFKQGYDERINFDEGKLQELRQVIHTADSLLAIIKRANTGWNLRTAITLVDVEDEMMMMGGR
jgi:hypothetical protein